MKIAMEAVNYNIREVIPTFFKNFRCETMKVLFLTTSVGKKLISPTFQGTLRRTTASSQSSNVDLL